MNTCKQCKNKVLIQTYYYTNNRTHLFTTIKHTLSWWGTKAYRSTRILWYREAMPLEPTQTGKGVAKGTACTLKVGILTVTTASTSPDSEAAFLDCRHIFLVMLHRGSQNSYEISDRCKNALKASTVTCQRTKSIGIAIQSNMDLKFGM